jgi:hypothetical protein
MRFALCTVLVWSSVAAAADVKYGVSARTELRGRTPLPGDTGTVLTGDLELDPIVDLAVVFHTGALALQYAPVLIWREPQTGGRLLPLQRGRFTAGKKWERATLLFSEDAAWGLADIGALRTDDTPNQPPGTVSPVQTLGGVPYVRSATYLALDAQPSTRVSFGLSGSYSVSGSTEPVATTALPLQYGPTGAARLRLIATRLDAFTTQLGVSQATFVTGQEQLIAALTERWDRPLARQWSFSINVGAALTREVVIAMQGIPGTYLEVLPVGGASTTWNEKLAGQPLQLSASVRVAPFADRFTGFVYERAEASLQATWKPEKQWVVTAAGAGALAVPLGRAEQNGDRLLSAEAGATWTITPWLLLQGSVRVLWTEQPRLGVLGQVQAAGSVSVTVKEQDSVAW